MRITTFLTSLALAAVTLPANAATVIVDAQANSSTGGSALGTGLLLTAGQSFSISSSLDDLWSAGALPRFSDANGLVGTRFATATDDSGEAVGTQISTDFGLHSQNAIDAPFGALVGRIGATYQLLGANFSGMAWNTGELELFYWDSNSGDNAGSIAFDVEAVSAGVPEPASWAMLIIGFAAAGHVLRRRQRIVRVRYI